MCSKMDLWPAGASSDNLQRVTPPSSQDGAGGHKAIRSICSKQVMRNIYTYEGKTSWHFLRLQFIVLQVGRKRRPSHTSSENLRVQLDIRRECIVPGLFQERSRLALVNLHQEHSMNCERNVLSSGTAIRAISSWRMGPLLK